VALERAVWFDPFSCSVCGGREDLWLCIICGHIGCGRYNGEPSPGADVEGVRSVLVQSGTGAPSPGADVGGVRPVLVRMLRCGGSSPGADVGGDEPSPGADVTMWHGRAQSRRRCGRGEPSPGADVEGMCPVLVQMLQRCMQSRCRCGSGARSPGADVGGSLQDMLR
jgi:hypothetical protein